MNIYLLKISFSFHVAKLIELHVIEIPREWKVVEPVISQPFITLTF